MDESDSKSNSHANHKVMDIAINEPSLSQDGEGETRSESSNDAQPQKDDAKADVRDVEVSMPEHAEPLNDKAKLQDQTNLLPLKQLLIVFAGLSCALFCKTSLFVKTQELTSCFQGSLLDQTM
jgi:hypothetical protein